MTKDDYRYVEGFATKYPHWGTELALLVKKRKTKITISTARFDPSEENCTAMLVGIRSIWLLDDDQKKCKIIGIQRWTAETGFWFDHDTNVSAGHRAVLASFLMGRWSMGKLRGRITDKL